MRDVAILGRDHIKVDSLDKVLGRAKFAADYYMPDMLYGGVFRSTVPHAYIKKLNLEKARALPGVAAVLDHTAIPGKNRFGIIVKDEPCLVDDKVRRYGDAIAVVAAETPEIVQEAMQLIEVEYEELPVERPCQEAHGVRQCRRSLEQVRCYRREHLLHPRPLPHVHRAGCRHRLL